MLVKFGGGILDARGSVGGNVYSRNRYGNYVRSRTAPVNPSSARQQLVRSIMSSLVSHWSETLTAAQRTAWATYADSINMVNKLGESITLSAFNHYIRSNMAILNVGGTRVDAGPTTLSLPAADPALACAATADDQKLAITFDDTLDWCDEDDAYLSVLMSMPKGAGVEFIGGPYQYAGKIEGDSVTAPTSPVELDCPFTVGTGQVIEVQARIIRADGRVSAPFRDKGTVAAS